MLHAILNRSWRQYPTKQHLYDHLPAIMKTIKIRWTRLMGHCCRSRKEHISDVLLLTPSHGWAKAGRPARTYIQQLCADMRCSAEDLPKAIDNREVWRERVRNIHADSMTWWWWWWWYIHLYICTNLSGYQEYFVMSMILNCIQWKCSGSGRGESPWHCG